MSKSQSAAPEGSPTHSPKIRILGVQSGSPRYAALVDQYRARLGAFHERHQQQARISGNSQYAGKVAWPGARAIYQNNNGQETITMIVDPLEEGSEETVSRETPWDFAMIDFVFDPLVGKGHCFMAAELAKPLTKEQKALASDTGPPVQGTSAWGWDQIPKGSLVEWADGNDLDAGPIQSVVEASSKMVRSLRVDLRPFPNQTIEVDLYGWVNSYTKQGGNGEGADHITQVDKFGSLTQDFSGLDMGAWSPAGWSSAPVKFYYKSSFPLTLPQYLTALLDTFPELAAFPALEDPSSGSSEEGDRNISASFNTPGAFAPWHWDHSDLTTAGWGSYLGAKAASVDPATDPNAWVVATPFLGSWTGNAEVLKTYEDWAPGFHKKSTMDCVVMQGPFGADPGDGFGVTASVPTTLNYPTICDVAYFNQITYYVPTWAFSKKQPFTVRAVCAKGGNPWTVYSKKQNDSDHGNNDTYQWEVKPKFPERPKMKDIGGGELPKNPPVSSNSVKDHYGAEKVGTLKIDTKSGGVKFEAA